MTARLSSPGMSDSTFVVPADGPFYDDLEPGMDLEPQPPVTIDVGLAAWYQSIVGEVLPLCLDHRLSARVTGAPQPLASPGLMVNLAVGQSTVATRRAIANLFYRNMRILRPVHVGETLHTRVRVEAMADAKPRDDRPNRGKVLLGIQTTADDELVLDCQRCALLPMRGADLPGHAQDTGRAPDSIDIVEYADLVPASWDASHLPPARQWELNKPLDDITRDVVDLATGLARLTHNRAVVHRDAAASAYGQRLVYGGHVQALAQASLTRLDPTIGTVLAWHTCNHLAPAFEGDLLSFTHALIAEHETTSGLVVRAFETVGTAHRDASTAPTGVPDTAEVLRWVPVTVSRQQ